VLGDAVLRVGGTVELRVHRCILIARSDYFRALFLGDFAEGAGGSGGDGGGEVVMGLETVAEGWGGAMTEVEVDGVEPRTMRVRHDTCLGSIPIPLFLPGLSVRRTVYLPGKRRVSTRVG
jgi:hypothetical protein